MDVFLDSETLELQRAPSIATALDLQESHIYPYGLEFKDDALQALRKRGAQEVENSFLTLSNTKSLISLVRKHMSRAVRSTTSGPGYMCQG